MSSRIEDTGAGSFAVVASETDRRLAGLAVGDVVTRWRAAVTGHDQLELCAALPGRRERARPSPRLVRLEHAVAVVARRTRKIVVTLVRARVHEHVGERDSPVVHLSDRERDGVAWRDGRRVRGDADCRRRRWRVALVAEADVAQSVVLGVAQVDRRVDAGVSSHRRVVLIEVAVGAALDDDSLDGYVRREVDHWAQRRITHVDRDRQGAVGVGALGDRVHLQFALEVAQAPARRVARDPVGATSGPHGPAGSFRVQAPYPQDRIGATPRAGGAASPAQAGRTDRGSPKHPYRHLAVLRNLRGASVSPSLPAEPRGDQPARASSPTPPFAPSVGAQSAVANCGVPSTAPYTHRST